MNTTAPRFEFRAFAKNFGLVETKMRQLAKCEQIRESSETYIVSGANNRNNVKVRDGQIDIKVLIGQEMGLERWNPVLKTAFPLPGHIIRDEVLAALGIQGMDLKRPSYTLEEFLDGIIRGQAALVAVSVFKRRFGFTIDGCTTELAEIWANGAGIQSVAVESTDVQTILATKAALALDEYENVNYVLALKRIIGMEPLPAC